MSVHDSKLAILGHDHISDGLKKDFEYRVRAFAGSVEQFRGLSWCIATWFDGPFERYPSSRVHMVQKTL